MQLKERILQMHNVIRYFVRFDVLSDFVEQLKITVLTGCLEKRRQGTVEFTAVPIGFKRVFGIVEALYFAGCQPVVTYNLIRSLRVVLISM